MNNFFGLIGSLSHREVYSLLFIGALIGGLLTYLTLLKRADILDDKKIIAANSFLEQPIILIDSNRIIKRYMSLNYSSLESAIDLYEKKEKVKQKLVEFLRIHTKGKKNLVIDMDGFITGAIDFTNDIGKQFILYLDKMERFK